MMNKKIWIQATGLWALTFSLISASDQAVEVELLHDTMEMRIGYPAIISPGDSYPSIRIASPTAATLEGEIINEGTGEPERVIEPRELEGGEGVIVEFGSEPPSEGRYRVQLSILDGRRTLLTDTYFFSVLDAEALPSAYSVAAHPGADGKLVYIPDYRGNRIPDFSGVGYKGGADIPDVPAVISLSPEPGDNTRRIQAAIDEASALEPDESGFRGAVLLEQGVYEVEGSLAIAASGVVLRGVGPGDSRNLWLDPANHQSIEELKESLDELEATVLVATGDQRRVLITISGSGGVTSSRSSSTEILDAYVPVGANSFHVTNPERFEVGDRILVERRGNAEWISEIGMDSIPERPDGGNTTQWPPFNLQYEYVVTGIDGKRITIDSSIVNAIERRWGGGRVYTYTDEGRITRAGVENLRAISFWTPNDNGVDDTRHADRFLRFDNIRDAWARNITIEHFFSTSGAFFTGRGSLGITIEDSSTLIADPDFYSGPGYDSSGRTFHETGVYVGRYGFYFAGQNGLVRNCFATNNRHAFAVGSRVTGPNVFSDSVAVDSLTYSEPHHRWSTGGLYDNVSDTIALMNRLWYGSGHGWAGANYVAWNTTGELRVEQPPTAQNWAIGHVGEQREGPFHDWNMDRFGFSFGYWESKGAHVKPQSLYTRQLNERRAQQESRF